ncbi:hypothetical protein EVG20_g5215 [Dentipellis fragilis]|uniref:Uncharacterized protein n=1 Tax=Dentipellis fragilis TaxID=205917 RepID=A0A4Y9YWB4_9AGAM|nr:hypothetical protein EVG20_g5215 [Dentipellis fragilis]
MLLFGIYHKIFSDEDSSSIRNKTPETAQALTLVHYVRASFAALLRLVKSRVQTNWAASMDALLDLIAKDQKLILGSNSFQELCCQLHLFGVYSYPALLPDNPAVQALLPSDILRGWENVPFMVSVSIIVPRKRLQELEQGDIEKIGTPTFICEAIKGPYTILLSAYGLWEAHIF